VRCCYGIGSFLLNKVYDDLHEKQLKKGKIKLGFRGLLISVGVYFYFNEFCKTRLINDKKKDA
jgi:hypothetical protein